MPHTQIILEKDAVRGGRLESKLRQQQQQHQKELSHKRRAEQKQSLSEGAHSQLDSLNKNSRENCECTKN